MVGPCIAMEDTNIFCSILLPKAHCKNKKKYSGCRLQLQGCTQICKGGCGITWNTQCPGCTMAMVLLFYSHFKAIFGGHTSDTPHLKHIILFSNVTSLKGAVTSYMMSQHCMCIGHMIFYYKRPTNASVGGSGLLFIHSSGSTLSPETHVWLVPNACRS